MAKINIEYDTKEKTLAVSMDGKKMPNISQIGIYSYKNYKDEDENHIELTSLIGNEEEGLYERHCIYANHEEKTVSTNVVTDIENLAEKLSKQYGHK